MVRPVVRRPLLGLAPHLAHKLVSGSEAVQSYFAATPDQPAWIKGVPLFGRRLCAAWDRVGEVRGNLRALLEPDDLFYGCSDSFAFGPYYGSRAGLPAKVVYAIGG